MRSLTVLCLLALASPALASPPPASASDIDAYLDAYDIQQLKAPRPKQLGFALQTGLPDGFSGSAVYRPFGWLRTHLGAGYNMVGLGLQGGATLIPFGWGPSFTLEGGHYFEGDANGIARSMAGAGFASSSLLERVGYDYANAHLGLELGRGSYTFFLHAGMSYMVTHIHGINEALEDSADGEGASIRIGRAPTVSAFAPSLKLGFVMYVW
jgi:hypothetical protein